jgi:alkylation response protein AidB-like acyl-CoA dehydrogenase
VSGFTFTEEQEMFRKAAREFAETKVAPHVAQMEETAKMSAELITALGEAEMMALTVPEEYGGLGLGYTARLIALEEIGRTSGATAITLQVFALGIAPIEMFGSERQKKKYLPGLATGARLATVGVTEATGGSDPKGIRASYKKDGGDYILTGRKCFITNSHIADTITVLARDEENADLFSCFIVESGTEGFKPAHEEHKMGMRGCNTGWLVFEDCRIPGENLLWEEGRGLRIAMSAIGEVGRAGMVGCALGLHTASLEASVKFAKERILYGEPISNLQTIQNKLAEMKIDLEAGRLLGYRATSMQDQGMRASNELAAAKYFTTEAAQKAAKMAVDIHGAYGCLEEYPVNRYLRDSYLVGASAGTSDIMKVIVARWALE